MTCCAWPWFVPYLQNTALLCPPSPCSRILTSQLSKMLLSLKRRTGKLQRSRIHFRPLLTSPRPPPSQSQPTRHQNHHRVVYSASFVTPTITLSLHAICTKCTRH